MRRPDPAVLLSACLLAVVSLPWSILAAQAPRTPSGTIVETEEAMKVTMAIQCFCGTCVNQTLHECTCGVATAERKKVQAALDAGETPESLIAAYVAEHGAQVMIVPGQTGLDRIAWWVPFAVALAGLAALAFVLRSWQRRAAGREPQLAVAAGSPADAAYRERLRKDLEELG